MYNQVIDDIRNTRQDFSPENAKNAAVEILKLSKDAEIPVRIIEICRNMGFSVYQQDLPRDICGYIMINGELKDRFSTDRIVSVNSRESNKRRRFTVAHELAHFLFDFNPNQSIQYFNMFELDHVSDDSKEERANRFAAELLMPEKIFIDKYNELQQNDSRKDFYSIVQELSDYFLVPPKAVERRIVKELKLHEP